MPKRKTARTFKEYMDTRLTPIERTQVKLEASIIAKMIDARKQQGLSQQELAEMAGVKQPAVARLENMNVTPKIDTVLEILYPLGYTLEVVPLRDNLSKV